MKQISILVLLFSCFAVTAAQSPWLFSSRLLVEVDDNLVNGHYKQDKITDYLTELSVRAGYSIDLDSQSLLNLNATAAFQHYQDTASLQNQSITFGADYHWQSEFGFLAPYYRASASIKQSQFEQYQRDATAVTIGINRTQRLTHLITFNSGLSYQTSDAEYKVFSADKLTAYADIDYDFSDRLSGYANVTMQFGDLTSSYVTDACMYNYPNKNYEYQWLDKGLAEDHCGEWYSYMVSDATTYVVTLGGNYILPANWLVDVSFIYADSSKDYYGYTRQKLALSLLKYF